MKKKESGLLKEILNFNELKYRAGIKIVLYRLSGQLSILNDKKYENIYKI